METGTIKRVVLVVAAVILALVLSYCAGYIDGLDSAVIGEHEFADTLYIRDTITQYEPIIEERVVSEKVYVPVIKMDTLWKHDTLLVYMEKEQVMWQDSLSRVYASGILPQIDSVEHFIKERVVTRELTKVVKQPCRWGVGIHAGYGIQLGEQVRTVPYIGAGVTYNLLSW